MKKRWIAAAAVLGMAAVLLTACGEKETSESREDTQKTQTNAQSTQTADGAGQGQSTAQSGDAQAAGQDADSQSTSAGQQDAQPVTESTYDQANQSGDENPQDDTDNADARWNGSFTSASGETLTIIGADGSTCSFAFSQCGISGSARKDDHSGDYIYSGDDSAVVVFALSGDTIEVSVTSEEDYDMSESPMIGSYGRNAE